MAEEQSYDVIVVGSGLASSVFAAAMARVGKRVAHIDAHDYYGGDWGTLPLRDFLKWVQTDHKSIPGEFDYAVEVPAPFQLAPFKQCYSPNCRSARGGKCYSPTCKTTPWQAAWTNALKNDRRFCIDLSAKLFHARGGMVNLLVSSNVSRYLEFNTVEESLIYTGKQMQLVPSSKEGLLTNTTISLRDKRVLSKFLQNVLNFIDGSCDGTNLAFRADGTFDELLTAQSFSSELKDYVIQAMAMVAPSAPWRAGVLSTQKYLRSLNVYGSTAFLVSSYGAGELPQAFCRMSAVYGGMYMLGTPHTLQHESGRLVGVSTQYGLQRAPLLVVPAPPHPTNIAHRTVAILSGPSPRLASRTGRTNDTAVVAVIPPRVLPPAFAEAGVAVHVLQLGPGAHVCPEGFAVLHLTFPAPRAAAAASAHLAEHVLRMFARMPGDSGVGVESAEGGAGADAPSVLFLAHFVLPTAAEEKSSTPPVPAASNEQVAAAAETIADAVLSSGAAAAAAVSVTDPAAAAPITESMRVVYLGDTPGASLSVDDAIENARTLFHSLLGAVEFLPAAPNPEDIVWTEAAPDATEGQGEGGSGDAPAGASAQTTEGSVGESASVGESDSPVTSIVAAVVETALASGSAAAVVAAGEPVVTASVDGVVGDETPA